MNYRHIYHAGNFADVFKHVVLIALTQSLIRKDAPFCYLDTHAGIGQYDLQSEPAQKSKEFHNGILKIAAAANPPPLVSAYLDCVSQLNQKNRWRFYPGSPMIVKHFLRPIDRMILCELQKEDYSTLKSFFGSHKKTTLHHQDGYQALKAYLPPIERRGLVLMDPPFEQPNEFSALKENLAAALKRFETGVYAIWYPIKKRADTTRWIESLKTTLTRPCLTTELCIYPDDVSNQLNGCGMLVINPPWQLDVILEETVPWLWKALSIDQQGFSHTASYYNES